METRQPALLDEVIAERTEAKSGLIVAEARARIHAKPYVGEARSVAVAVLDAEINHPADDQGIEVSVCK